MCFRHTGVFIVEGSLPAVCVGYGYFDNAASKDRKVALRYFFYCTPCTQPPREYQMHNNVQQEIYVP